MKQWRCTVCGYIHTGPEPPEVCPICGADKSMFVEVVQESPGPPVATSAPEPPADVEPGAEPEPEPTRDATAHPRWRILLNDQIRKHHLHPISVHVPNGVMPLEVIMIVLAALLDWLPLAHAALYNTLFVVLTLPFVLYSGYTEWQEHYGGHLTRIFFAKIMAALAASVTAPVVLVWLLVNPRVMMTDSPQRWVFLGVCAVLLAAVGTAGYFGGKLVFHD